jgi:hypothetical protein
VFWCLVWVVQVVQRDQTIVEKEKLYVELKKIVARQPGPEVAEQLSVYQSNLKERTRQMKALAAELNMYQAQVRTSVSPAHAYIWSRAPELTMFGMVVRR